MIEQPSYYAVIPANVRYSKQVSSGAKLLYGEITCLCNVKGFCWASNAYFADLYTASNKTISRWISELAKAGFIASLVDDASGNSRKIWLAQPVIDGTNLSIPMDKNVHRYGQKCPDPMDKNVQQNNIVNNKENKGADNTEKAPAPAENSFALEEKKETPQVAAAPSFKEPTLAACLPIPHHSDKPQNLETHNDLLTKIQAYYKANPREWIDSVKAMSGPTYTDAQLVSMLQDYCSHNFSHRNPYQKFSQHNSDFCRWVKNQKTFARREQPTTQTDPTKNLQRFI